MSRSVKPCRTHRQMLSLLAAGLLPEDERRPLENHLARCTGCRRYHAELGRLMPSLRQLPERLPDAEPTVAMIHRWNRAIRQAADERRGFGWAASREVAAGWQSLWKRRPALLSGVAVVWVLTLALYVSEPTPTMHASGGPPLLPQVAWEALRSHTEGAWPMAEVELPPSAKPASPVPRPRSERPQPWLNT